MWKKPQETLLHVKEMELRSTLRVARAHPGNIKSDSEEDVSHHVLYESDIEMIQGKASLGRRSRSVSPEKKNIRPESPYASNTHSAAMWDRNYVTQPETSRIEGRRLVDIVFDESERYCTNDVENMFSRNERDPDIVKRPKSAGPVVMHKNHRKTSVKSNNNGSNLTDRVVRGRIRPATALVRKSPGKWSQMVARAPVFRQNYLLDLEIETAALLQVGAFIVMLQKNVH